MMMIRTTTTILLLVVGVAVTTTSAAAADASASSSASSSTSTAAVTQLTVDTFETLTEGKSVFIKFFAPWCGHCRSMADDWEKLAKEWNDHPVGLIAEVDCTSDGGQPICEDFDVQSFPTLVYGDPMSAETYDGDRDYKSLSEFAIKHISKPICSFFNPNNCYGNELKLIELLEQKSTNELEDIVKVAEELVSKEEILFDEKVVLIQKQYDQLVEEFNLKLEDIKEKHNYKFVEQLLTIRLMMEDEDDEDEDDAEAEKVGSEL